MSTNILLLKTSQTFSLVRNSLKPTATCYFVVILSLFIALTLLWFMGAGSSSPDMQAPLIVASQARHTASLIFLHGLGDTGHGWADTLGELRLKNIRCICPTAPIQPVTLNAGMRMPSWFDIIGLSGDDTEDEAGIKKASSMLKHWIEEEEKQGIPSNRIMVGGFSQGGAVALYTALTLQKPLGGVVALSTWMPLSKTVPQLAKSSSNSNIPILQCHGESDPLVQFSWGKKTHELLSQFNKNCQFKSYPHMMHSSSPQEMKDVHHFLETTFPPEK
ncbi:acyl-protein thioesterase 1-like [Liolophura sinensis]|uniref:acyl-protein thioesterase 1-like n=1 Tax=Liolophura sinensis TaxID=3198878 RepID=UPI0031586052